MDFFATYVRHHWWPAASAFRASVLVCSASAALLKRSDQGVSAADEECDPQFSLRYAAPELVAAKLSGRRNPAPQQAHDVWALGVTALELFSSARVFDPSTVTAEQVCYVSAIHTQFQ